MDLIRTLNSIGKSTFVKYYYNFKNQSRDACIIAFTENYTDKAKSTRTGHAQRIFREGMQKDALQLVINSNRVDDDTIARAHEILKSEF
ncbi:MAG: hypothetical protein ABFD18_02865 [Syntrophomonas sp.]